MKLIHLPSTKSVTLLLSLFTLVACGPNYVANPNFPEQGPMVIEKPAPQPAPEPMPEPEPVMSVAQQNSQAIEALTELGFETQENDRGVVVYLPPNIYFQGSSADISLQARTKIAEIASEVNKDYLTERLIEISGHTDSIGDAENNLALSRLRTEAAAQELTFSRVDERRLIKTWFGESRPRAPEFDSNGKVLKDNRASNRRVEFTILNPDS